MLLQLPLLLAPLHLAAAQPRRLSSFAASNTSTASNSTLLPAVCTPDQCLVGANSLTAGVVVSSPINGSTQRVSLLPGTYSSSSAAFTSSNSTTSSLASSVFSKSSTAFVSNGFSASGSLSSASSSYSVSLLDGLTAYTSALYQGTTSYIALPTNYTSSNSSSSSSSNASASAHPSGISSLLLPASSSAYAVLTLGSSSTRLVVWDSLPDVGEIKGGAGSGGVTVVDVQGTGCASPCASGGVCTASGKCACGTGWTGDTCNACATGFFGKSCEACPAGCKDCDDGLTGTGLCLDVVATNVTLPSTCNCINGECASNSTTATCSCNAGWAKAANGTQCAACADGYYMTSGGDCLACDPSCATCSSPSGTCLTCQSGLQPSSSSSTKCITATTALNNGSFITCPSRTFFSSSADGCVDCNPLCESCFKEGTDGCLACRSPNVLLGGQCVAMDSKTGVCDASGARGNATAGATNGGYVYDNSKEVCDALPAKCTAGAINNFSSSSSRSLLTCSACLPGSYLVDGECVSSCPSGTRVSSDGLSCEACSSSCATCSSTSASYCTSCTSSSALLLNGTCITSSSCPTGYFAPSTNTSTCLTCHPDCATCSGSSTTCLTCPSSRPVLTSSGSCVPTCASTEYWDTSKSACVACSSGCATCSGAGSDACLSCASGSRLSSGKCVAAEDGCTWVDGFGVCLSDLVTVAATSAADEEVSAKWTMPWWLILVIVLVVVTIVGLALWWFRKREQKRRREHTRRFANELGNKEVDKKLAALPTHVAYPAVPALPRSPSSPSNPAHLDLQRDAYTVIPLTPQHPSAHHARFVLEDPSSPISPAPSRSSYAPSEAVPPPRTGPTSRWSASSFASSAIKPQRTGSSFASSAAASTPPLPTSRTFTTKAGNTLTLNGFGSKNPFLGRV
ncbi:hypothetical protein JCM8097_003689 [Rhodosporidiobolus ruineniae]